MRIQSIQTSNFQDKTKFKKVSFNAWEREVFKVPKNSFIKELKHRNDTSFFRDGVFWKNLIYHLLYKYNKTPKVNVYNYACSDGSEPYTFLMSLIANYGMENTEKFLPIKARDYDSAAIEKAKSHEYTLRSYELKMMDIFTMGKSEMFFDFYKSDNDVMALPKEILTSNVDFKVSNIMNDYKKIKPQNSIVFARNFWPYLKEDAITLVKKLSSQMGANSTLILGRFDVYGCEWCGIDIVQELVSRGFKKSQSMECVFNKED